MVTEKKKEKEEKVGSKFCGSFQRIKKQISTYLSKVNISWNEFHEFFIYKNNKNIRFINLTFHIYIYYTLKGPRWNCQNERIRHAKVLDFSPPDKLLRGTGSGDSDVGLTLISSIFLFALIRKRVKYLIRVIQHSGFGFTWSFTDSK